MGYLWEMGVLLKSDNKKKRSKKDVILVVKRILKCGDVKPKITTMACRDDDNFDNQKTKM